MKIRFLIFDTKAPAWVETARSDYAAKIRSFTPFDVQTLKSPQADRDDAERKRRREGEILLKNLDARELVVLFDEGGKLASRSEEFAREVGRVLDSGKGRAAFCIGGPYGFSDEVKARAELKWSLSPLTMNHWIAQLAALEQIYRALTILKGMPYHNR